MYRPSPSRALSSLSADAAAPRLALPSSSSHVIKRSTKRGMSSSSSARSSDAERDTLWRTAAWQVRSSLQFRVPRRHRYRGLAK